MTDQPTFAEQLGEMLRRDYEERVATVTPCLLCGQLLAGHDQAACDAKMAAWKPTGYLLPSDLVVNKVTTHVEVPHELLIDSGTHTCDATCLALYGNAYPRTPAPLPRATRIRYALRRARWRLARLGGLRLVHKDRIDQDADD